MMRTGVHAHSTCPAHAPTHMCSACSTSAYVRTVCIHTDPDTEATRAQGPFAQPANQHVVVVLLGC
eukprot:1481272-Alexandrium_andersonii.AAC.1